MPRTSVAFGTVFGCEVSVDEPGAGMDESSEEVEPEAGGMGSGSQGLPVMDRFWSEGVDAISAGRNLRPFDKMLSSRRATSWQIWGGIRSMRLLPMI